MENTNTLCGQFSMHFHVRAGCTYSKRWASKWFICRGKLVIFRYVENSYCYKFVVYRSFLKAHFSAEDMCFRFLSLLMFVSNRESNQLHRIASWLLFCLLLVCFEACKLINVVHAKGIHRARYRRLKNNWTFGLNLIIYFTFKYIRHVTIGEWVWINNEKYVKSTLLAHF